MSETTFMGVPRDSIDWSPIIDFEKCNYCNDSVEFCPHNVFEVRENEEQKLVVKNPNNCVVFCRSCRKVCAADALEFPKKPDVLKIIKEKRGY